MCIDKYGYNQSISGSPTEKFHRWAEVNRAVNSYISASKKFSRDLGNAVYDRWINEKSFDKIIGDYTDDIFAEFMRMYFAKVYQPMINRMLGIAKNHFKEDLSKQGISNIVEMPLDRYSPFVQEIERNGLAVLSDNIMVQNREALRQALVDGRFNGLTQPQIKNLIQFLVGSGTDYKYNRIIRSETSIAIDNATIAQSGANGVNYVQWISALNACPICKEFTNKIWEVKQNPRPVYSTHPNCFCTLRPRIKLKPGETVQQKYFIEQKYQYAA